jgi:flavin reductase (DIM6/NTAB) family NADH-FMN oxidoreductase RutF
MSLKSVMRSVRRASARQGSGREVLEAFVASLDYPMFVVTAQRRRRRDGCLVGFVTQTSIDPPRLLVCLSRSNATTRTARRARYLGVHQLGAGQLELARIFGGESGDWTDKFKTVAWRAGPHHVPLLEDAPAWLVGRVIKQLDVGDHRGFLLEPVAGRGPHDQPPLTLQAASSVEPGHPA